MADPKDLMQRYCDGDANAFRELYALVAPRLLGYLVKMTRSRALAATLEGAFFPYGIHAWSARIGARYHHLDAAFRVLDFDVGPALFGPEIGVGF